MNNNNPLTVKEFKSILNRYDMNERDRDRLTAWHKQASETIEKTSSIDTIDFTPFLVTGVIHEGGHNTVDFENNSNFKTINSLVNSRAAEPPAYLKDIKLLIRTNIKKILTNKLNKLPSLGDISNIFNINETFIANLAYEGISLTPYIASLSNGNYEFNKILKSFATLDIIMSGRNRLQQPSRGIDVNALFYISNDIAIDGTPVSRRAIVDPINISNHFIHAHICLGNNQLFADMMNGVNVLTDEYIDNLPFISYVEVSEIKKKPATIDINSVLPYNLSPEQITAIQERNVDIVSGKRYINPLCYSIIDADVHNIYIGAIIFLNPGDMTFYNIKIEANQITEIVVHRI